MDTKVLIVSVYYNRAGMVRQSVGSVVEQLEPDMHLLLVDDGSRDDTLTQLQRWESDQVSVMTHSNCGFVASIRAAIDAIPSTYIAIHGSGDLSLPGRFRKQTDYLDQHQRVGVVGCHSHCVFSDGKWQPYIEAKKFTGDASRHMLTGNLFHHGEVMMRRDCYEVVGGYRTFFKFAQDRDLFCRLSQITEFHVIEDVLYTHFIGVPGSVSGSAEKVVMQRFLSDFACYCHRQRLAGKPDPLIEYGPRAGLLWSPGKRTMRDLFRRAIRALYGGNRSEYVIYKSALIQQGARPWQRLFFLFADAFPAPTGLVLQAYYHFRLSGSTAPT